MATAIGYLRVSTEEQSLGPEAQRHAIEAFCASHGLELASVHADLGVSGAAAFDRRPGLTAALDELEAGAVLVIAKRDRLGRDPILCALAERMAERVGARIVSAAGEGTEGDSPTDVLMRRIVDAFAEYERLLIKARTKAALGAKRRRGEHVGRVPYGYALEGTALVEVPAEQAVIAEARRLRDAGLTLRDVAHELASAGLRPRNGGTWHPTQVARMLGGK